MSACACGCAHHHHLRSGAPAPVGNQISLSGHITCADPAQLMTLLMHVEAHVAASRAEPGCLHFEITQTDDPMVWRVEGLFHDIRALEAHRERSAASPWSTATAGFAQDIHDLAAADPS